MKEEIKQFKERNGNAHFTQKDMIMYVISKVDCIDRKIGDGAGKIATNQANIKTLYWILGILVTISIASLGLLLK